MSKVKKFECSIQGLLEQELEESLATLERLKHLFKSCSSCNYDLLESGEVRENIEKDDELSRTSSVPRVRGNQGAIRKKQNEL